MNNDEIVIDFFILRKPSFMHLSYVVLINPTAIVWPTELTHSKTPETTNSKWSILSYNQDYSKDNENNEIVINLKY